MRRTPIGLWVGTSALLVFLAGAQCQGPQGDENPGPPEEQSNQGDTSGDHGVGGGNQGDNSSGQDDSGRPEGAGYVTFRLPDGHVYRIEAERGAVPEDISVALNQLGVGSDNWLNISPDGAWLLLDTERFDADCAGYGCLAIVDARVTGAESVRADGHVVHPWSFGAVASGGGLIVYPDTGGPHDVDLWAIRRGDAGWTTPLLLTGASTYPFNSHPALSADGSKVVFDGGPVPYGQEGTAICEVSTDGTGFRVVLTTADAPPGLPVRGALHHPDYAPDGSVVFEGDWDGEQIWRLPPGASVPVRVARPDSGNDNSPCVLPDGRIVSLLIGQAGGTDNHNLKVMEADGSNPFILYDKGDVIDGGIGCGG